MKAVSLLIKELLLRATTAFTCMTMNDVIIKGSSLQQYNWYILNLVVFFATCINSYLFKRDGGKVRF